MRRRRLFLAVLASAGALVGACSSFTSESPAPAPDDAGTDEGAVAIDAPDDAPAPRTGNLLLNPGFEEGCAGWGPSDTDPMDPSYAQSDTLFVEGAHACLVCSRSAGSFSVVQKVLRPAKIGAKVTGALQVRSAGDGGAGLDASMVAIVTFDSNGTANDRAQTPGPTVKAAWQRTATALNVVKDFTQVALRFSGTASAGGYCYVVDDATLVVTDP